MLEHKDLTVVPLRISDKMTGSSKSGGEPKHDRKKETNKERNKHSGQFQGVHNDTMIVPSGTVTVLQCYVPFLLV
jgi:hypothetical protein